MRGYLRKTGVRSWSFVADIGRAPTAEERANLPMFVELLLS